MSAQSDRDHRAALAIEHIGINRIEGIREPFRIERLCPGLNLIHGPNAIGKSRTAEALQALVWPDTSSPRSELLGRLALSDDVWSVEIEGRRARFQRNGTSATQPGFIGTPSSHRDRYLLTLRDLLTAADQDFASAIQREAAGGYDLRAVRVEMKLTTAPKPRPSSAQKAYQEAAATVKTLRRDDQKLQGQERSLAELVSERDAASAAERRVYLLNLAREHVAALQRRDAARIIREAFPDPIGHMAGNEYARVEELRGKLQDAQQQRHQLEYELAGHVRELGATGFSREMPSTSLLAELRERLVRLREREVEMRQAQQEIAGHVARLHALRERMGENLSDDQLAALDGDGLRQLSKLTRDHGDVAATERAQSELLSWLGSVDAPANLDRLQQGTQLLAKRLRLGGVEAATAPGGLVKWTLIVAALAIVVEGVLLAINAAAAFVVVAAFAVPVAWVAVRKHAPPAEAAVDALRQEYERLGLESPSAWTPETVEPVLATLQSSLAQARLDEQKAIRWADLAEHRQRAAEQRDALLQRRAAAIRRYGVVPDEADPDSIRHLATAIDQWRQESDALTTCRASADEARQQAASLLASINETLLRYGASVAADAIGAAAAIDELAQRIEVAHRSRALRDTCERMLADQVDPAVAMIGQEIAYIFDAAGVEPGDAVALRALCERVEPCRAAQRSLEDAEAVVTAARARLGEAPAHASMTSEEIENGLADAQAHAARRDEIQKQISGIQAEIRHAKQQTRLQDATVRESEALDALRNIRERDYDNAAGWHVLEFVQAQNRDTNRPAVFRLADELLASFTSGAYRLELDDGTSPEFRAVETSSQRQLSLDQLSSGTRLQLLMVVRLAFIETAEPGPQLPLILDEALGNTDDTRANAIIDAAIEIARRGRQVIYFTAQHDEIIKWKARIAQHGDAPACETFDLATIRGLAGMEVTTPLSWDRSVFAEPVPEAMDYEAARVRLNVAPVDLWAEHIDGVDLWHLIPDVTTLVTLRHRGIKHWGAYRLLHQRNALKGVGSPEVYARAQARALVIETARREWQYGRPRPLTRQVLRDCGLITDTFFDAVAGLAEEQRWRSDALIEALRNRGVSGFRRNTMDELDEYFRMYGYMSDAEPLPDMVIRASVLSAVNDAIVRGVIHEREVDDVLMSLTGEPVASLVSVN